MADNTNKVTIDADYFAELYGYKEKYDDACVHCGQCQTDGKLAKAEKERDELKAKVNAYEPKIKELDVANLDAYEKIGCLRKERDELKAKLDCEDVDRETYKGRAEAAERCIDDIDEYRRDGDYSQEETLRKIGDLIRAYRDKKEAK